MWEISAGVMKREEQSTVGEEMCRGNMCDHCAEGGK